MWGIVGVGVASPAESPGLAAAMEEAQLDNLVGDSSPSSRILIRIPKRIRKPRICEARPGRWRGLRDTPLSLPLTHLAGIFSAHIADRRRTASVETVLPLGSSATGPS